MAAFLTKHGYSAAGRRAARTAARRTRGGRRWPRSGGPPGCCAGLRARDPGAQRSYQGPDRSVAPGAATVALTAPRPHKREIALRLRADIALDPSGGDAVHAIREVFGGRALSSTASPAKRLSSR